MASARSWVWVVWGLLGACGGDKEPSQQDQDGGASERDAEVEDDGDRAVDDPYAARSGTRIALRYESGEGGARSYAGMFDRELGRSCMVLGTGEMEAGERIERCLPGAVSFNAGYADADCKDAVAVVDTSCQELVATSYLVKSVRPASGCDASTITYHELGEQVTSGPGFTVDSANHCVARSAKVGERLYRFGPAFDLNRFAKVRTTKKPVAAGQFTLTLYEADDGLRLPLGLDMAGEYCTLQRVDGVYYCLPSWSEIPDPPIYPGNQCMGEPLGRIYYDSCYPTLANKYLAEKYGAKEDRCGEIKHLYRLGSEVSMGSMRSNSQICSAASTGSYKLFTRGTEVDVSAYAPFERHERGTGSLGEYSWLASDGTSVRSGNLFDRKTGEFCAGSMAVDGSKRCLPGTTAELSKSEFSDAACSAPLIRNIMSCLSDTKPTYFVLRNAPAKDACADSPWLAESVLKTEHYRGQVYRKNASGACIGSMPSADEAELFWKPVETLPATSFAALREEPIK